MHTKRSFAVCVCLFCLIVIQEVSADTLIFNNSTYTGYSYPQTPVSYTEMLDYGTSTGGLIRKFVFSYTSTSSGTVWVRFYRYTNSSDPGYTIKQFTLTNVPSTGGFATTYEYVIPEQDRFELAGGNFGYSFEFSNSTSRIVLATGGTGADRYFWQYDDWWDDFTLFDFGVAYNFYFKLYTAPPIDQITCDISGYKFDDVNGNSTWDVGEPNIPGWNIYLDTNNNDQYDPGVDSNTVTDPNSGRYFFENLASPATYTIREVLPDGWTQTLPGGPNYEYTLATEPNNVYGPYNFGNTTMTIVKYGGGSGTSGDPYQIETPEHMNEIGLSTDDWNKYFRLEADLDMSGYTGTQYNLIGNATTKFTGSFNGSNHVIQNFSYTTTAAKYYVGLFGYTSNAQISNLGLVNVMVSSAGWYVGGLAGYQTNGTAGNCYVTGGQVSGANSSQYVGGLAGYQSGIVVSNCRSDVNVNSGTNSSYVGGFAGRAGNLTNCYSAGAVTTGTGSTNVGGLAPTGGTIVSSYWDTESSTKMTGVGSPKTTEQMQMQSTFAGWNFTNIWRICAGTNYPRLQWEPLPVSDFVCPEGVELADVVFMADSWLLTGSLEADIAPATPDGKVNLQDFAAMADNWMLGID